MFLNKDGISEHDFADCKVFSHYVQMSGQAFTEDKRKIWAKNMVVI